MYFIFWRFLKVIALKIYEYKKSMNMKIYEYENLWNIFVIIVTIWDIILNAALIVKEL